jgi:hypothetical protein
LTDLLQVGVQHDRLERRGERDDDRRGERDRAQGPVAHNEAQALRPPLR